MICVDNKYKGHYVTLSETLNFFVVSIIIWVIFSLIFIITYNNSNFCSTFFASNASNQAKIIILYSLGYKLALHVRAQ